MLESECVLPFSGIDPKGRIKLGVLLEMFQGMADIDAGAYGFSVRDVMEYGVTWVLRSYRICLNDYPKGKDAPLRIKTYAEACRGLYSVRTFHLSSQDFRPLGSAYTWWVLVDIAKNRPIRLDKFEPASALKTQISKELPKEVKVPSVTNAFMEETWKVRWQDLDVNNHTNHAVYFNWALDTVPDCVPESMSSVFVEGEFLHPIPRTRVRCLTQEINEVDGRRFIHSLQSTEDESDVIEYARLSSSWKIT